MIKSVLKYKLVFLLSLVLTVASYSQNDTSFKKRDVKLGRFIPAISATALLWGGTIYYLNSEWYQTYPRTSLHLFNDNNEWLQMDKCGHAYTAYTMGYAGISMMRWSGFGNTGASLWGGLIGWGYLLNIEILDGLSKDWGFSLTDIAANSTGSAIVIAQQLAWKEQRIKLKFSFQHTDYAKINPSLLGYSKNEQILKDYNGQTYWLSANIHSFLNESSKFPRWLSIAFGYGADGMIGARDNESFLSLNVKRVRQYYFSLDADLTKIRTKSKFLKTIFGVVGVVKFPAPTVEFSNDKFKFYYFYF